MGLKKALLDEYGVFQRKNVSRLAHLFELNPDEPCQIIAEVSNGNRLRIMMSGRLPQGQAVADWAARWKADFIGPTGISFLLEKDGAPKLVELADVIEEDDRTAATALRRLFRVVRIAQF